MSATAVIDREDEVRVPTTPRRAGLQRELKPSSSRTGMKIHPLMPFSEWQALGHHLGTYASATSWWMGDWLNFGRQRYGRRYKEAVTVTGLEYQTLRNCAAVARRFEVSRRRDDVSFQHHAEVCAMDDDEQDRWLRLAAANGWSRNELRRRVRAAVAEGSAAQALSWLRFSVDPDREQRWRDAAEQEKYKLDEWIVAVLDRAASELGD